jgi:hypothetical protein
MPTLRPGRLAWLALLASSAMLGCSLFTPSAEPVTERPDDFSLVYEWREGSLPPPYHYEYTITVQADGLVTLTMVPDYPGAGVPVWTESLTLDAGALDTLFALLVAEDAFTTNWRAEDLPPVGGGLDWLTLTANGRTVELPPYPIEAQAASADRIQDAVIALVPQDIWDKLNAQRERYVAEHEEQ